MYKGERLITQWRNYERREKVGVGSLDPFYFVFDVLSARLKGHGLVHWRRV